MVAAAGKNPAALIKYAGGIFLAQATAAVPRGDRVTAALQGVRTYFAPKNREKTEGRTSLLPDSQMDFHGNGSESGSALVGAVQEMVCLETS